MVQTQGESKREGVLYSLSLFNLPYTAVPTGKDKEQC